MFQGIVTIHKQAFHILHWKVEGKNRIYLFFQKKEKEKKRKRILPTTNQYLEFLQLKEMNYLELDRISRKYLSLLSRNSPT